MAKKTLVIDGSDPRQFALAVDGGTVRLGADAAHVEGLLRDLRVVRVHCEVEFEDDRDQLPVDEPGVLVPHTLRGGAVVRLRHAELKLLGVPTATPEAQAAPTNGPAAAVPATGPRRLKVIDGGDQGKAFRLPESGTVTVGKVGGQADIALHDLYVAKVHCELAVDAGSVVVTHLVGANGTLVDGHRITQPQLLRPGSVLRVGNSHLRLEVGPFTEELAGDGSAIHRAVPAGSGTHRPVSPGNSGVLKAMLVEEGGGGKPAAVAPKPSRPKTGDPLADLEGQTLGAFQLGSLLGRGYTGAVFQATHAKSGQIVGLKVLAADFPASQAELDRFAEALKAANSIRHPNLQVPLGAGRSGAHCWMAREYVDGESAAAAVARIAEGEKPSWTRAARVAVHLARVLECLHEHRLVHGNITPQNVLLRTTDNVTKLADLRLAQALEGSKLQAAVLEKKLLAELPYLAPEQAEPEAFVDDLADLYGLGAVVYALVTGRPPVTGDSPAEILDQIHAGRVVRPSSYYKKVPAAFDAVVMKLLARHQEDRYPTAGALLADLAPLAEEYDLKV